MIHHTAEVKTSSIGIGTTIWQYTVILAKAQIGENCNICAHCFIENDIIIGNNVTIKSGVYLWDGITIEDNVQISPNVTFTNDKYPKSKNINFNLLRTHIKSGATIGAGAVILPGLDIGEYSMIGAGAVVTKSVPNRALVVGNPAKIVGWVNNDGTKMKKSSKYYIDNIGNRWVVIDNKLVAE